MIKLILVDFDGVIRHWPTDNSRLEKHFSLAPGCILKVAFNKALLEPVVRGQTTDEQWRSAIADALLQQYPDSQASKAVAQWSTSSGTVDWDVLSLL